VSERRPGASNSRQHHSSERDAWIALASTPGVGDVTFQRLLGTWGSAADALLAVADLPEPDVDARLASQLGLRRRDGLAAAIRASASDPGRPTRRMAELGGWTLTPMDAPYPARLHELEDPPPVLFGLGTPAALSAPPLVAVVGTRHPTGQGRLLATRIAARLAHAGVTVVSGLAVGIDGAAHAAALEAGGDSVAVLGSGLDAPSPSVHAPLADRIARHGAVVSELAPGVRPTAGTFPRRNRIVSALASATIVVEAPARSGALITARLALEQGRTLLVAPGRPLDPAVAGNLALLRETPAQPLVGLDEMLVDLGLVGTGESRSAHGNLPLDAALALLGDPERAVARALRIGPQTVDSLVHASGQPAGVVAAALTLLQLRGWARVMGSLQLACGPLLDGPTSPDGRHDGDRGLDRAAPTQRRMRP
jgi:DNA processing protein